ncbi:Receptor-Type Tyrosine-Protein Phosphatase Alpha [Manis pentadactyla]|nr:Receptor-Type Tyrosine-Protein Phosphatase Alpha [Manis pentadactyla]
MHYASVCKPCLGEVVSLVQRKSACGEVNSNGLNSKEKAESTIGRKIKIIKTNSNCSQSNQFHNFNQWPVRGFPSTPLEYKQRLEGKDCEEAEHGREDMEPKAVQPGTSHSHAHRMVALEMAQSCRHVALKLSKEPVLGLPQPCSLTLPVTFGGHCPTLLCHILGQVIRI